MKLVITIEAEEDNWGSYSPNGHTVANIERIPLLQELFDEFSATPTYLITYPVAVNDRAATILRSILDRGGCEIGAHCHPWNTPPFEEDLSEKNSMLCNLPLDLQYRKMSALDMTIQERLGVKPISFRAGRWGYSQGVAVNLHRLGYKIDSSITPYTSWAEYHGPNFSEISPEAYKFSSESIFDLSAMGPLLEIPATIGYLQRHFAMCARILNSLNHQPFRRLKLVGLLSRLRLVRKVWLSPEMADGQEMIQLAKRMSRNNYSVINLFFHSVSLKAGLSPFVRSTQDELKFLSRTRDFLSYTRDAGIELARLSDCPNS
jgi:hypothetical protein